MNLEIKSKIYVEGLPLEINLEYGILNAAFIYDGKKLIFFSKIDKKDFTAKENQNYIIVFYFKGFLPVLRKYNFSVYSLKKNEFNLKSYFNYKRIQFFDKKIIPKQSIKIKALGLKVSSLKLPQFDNFIKEENLKNFKLNYKN